MDRVAPACQVGAALLDADHRLMAEIATGTAVLLGDRGAQQAQCAGLVPDVAIHLPRLAPAFEMWRPFLGDEFRRQIAKHPVLIGHPDRHGAGSFQRLRASSSELKRRRRWANVSSSITLSKFSKRNDSASPSSSPASAAKRRRRR